MLQSTLESRGRRLRVPGGQSPGHFPRHRSEAVLEQPGLFCLHAWGGFGKWRRGGGAPSRSADREDAFTSFGAPWHSAWQIPLYLAATYVLRARDVIPQKICYLLFVICHLPSGRPDLPSRSSVHRASRTNGRPRSRYLSATNRARPKCEKV